MNKTQIGQLLQATEDKVTKSIHALGFDHTDENADYSSEQVGDIVMMLQWLFTENLPLKDAKQQYISYKESKDPLSALSPQERATIEKALDELGGQTGTEFRQILETRRNEVIGALLQRFDRAMINDIVGVVQSPEFKQNFGNFLLTGDRTALPGKPVESLPSSKAGATNS